MQGMKNEIVWPRLRGCGGLFRFSGHIFAEQTIVRKLGSTWERKMREQEDRG